MFFSPSQTISSRPSDYVDSFMIIFMLRHRRCKANKAAAMDSRGAEAHAKEADGDNAKETNTDPTLVFHAGICLLCSGSVGFIHSCHSCPHCGVCRDLCSCCYRFARRIYELIVDTRGLHRKLRLQ